MAAFCFVRLVLTTLRNRPRARAFRSRCQHHRKRESQHRLSGCGAARIRLRDPACRTTADRMAADGKPDRRREGLCAGGLDKRAYHFLRSFLKTHRSNTQISHNAISTAMTCSSTAMSFQKED